MSHFVTIAVIVVFLCLGLVQYATSSASNSTNKCQGKTCPQGQYCKSSSGGCHRLLHDSEKCDDDNACKGDLMCKPYGKYKILYCQRARNPAVNCHGQQCYVGQYCNKKWRYCHNLVQERSPCEGDYACAGSLKCVEAANEKFYCKKITTTTEATSTAGTEATSETDISEG